MAKIKKGTYNNLQIDIDDMGEGKVPILLFTPDMKDKMNHYHIELSRDDAEELKDYLEKYLEGWFE
jgi:hypothetical protein